jgi:hypothetical protein
MHDRRIEASMFSRTASTTSLTLRRANTRIVHGWIESAGMESSAFGTHSLRRTKAAQIYRKTGNLGNLWVAVFLIYAAPANSVDWPGPWKPGMAIAEREAFFHSEAECRDYAMRKIGHLHEGMLAPMRFQNVRRGDPQETHRAHGRLSAVALAFG